MAVVKFLGILRLETHTSEIEVNEKYLKDVLKSIDKKYDTIQYDDLKNAIIYINDKKVKRHLFRKIELDQKDVIAIFYPVAGG